MKLAEILTGPETWVQQALKGPQFCIGMALSQLWSEEGHVTSWDGERNRLARLIGLNGGGLSEIGTWNDAPERTWDEIAAVVDAYDRDRMLNP